MTRVLIADDHPLVLRGLSSLLDTQPEIELVGTCIHGEEVLELALREPPDCLIMDLKMPRMGALAVMSELREADSLPVTIVIAATAEAWEICEAERLGAWGVLMKDEAPRMILECIYSALDGESWVRPVETRRSPVLDVQERLTERESEIAHLASRGASNKAIARELAIAKGTVKVHLHRIYKKLDVSNRVGLALLLRKGRA